nr:hypothetical protein Iba_chr10aCG11060 [Ipomoea batatas]
MKRTFETLSTMLSQRYSDEEDLLERSTNKPKVDAGLNDERISDVATDPPSSARPPAPTSDGDEVVAETQMGTSPVDEQLDSNMQIEADPPLNSEPGIGSEQPLPVESHPEEEGCPTARESDQADVEGTTSTQVPGDASNVSEELSPEHHTNPPDSMDGEGDIVMEDDMPQGPGLAEDVAHPAA